MKDNKLDDDRSPEPPGHESEESNEDLESKSSPKNNISSDNESENISCENSGKEASLKRRKRVQRFADSDSDDQNQKSGCESANEASEEKIKSQAAPCSNNEESSDSDSAVSKNKAQTSRIKPKSSDDSTSDVNDVAKSQSPKSRIKSLDKSSDSDDSDVVSKGQGLKSRKKQKSLDNSSDSDDGDVVSKSQSPKSRIKQKSLANSSDSDDSDIVSKIKPPKSTIGQKSSDEGSNSDVGDNVASQNQPQKSRIRKVSSDSSSESDVNKSAVSTENSQGSRIKSKRDKLHQRFKNLITSRRKSVETKDNDQKEENSRLEGCNGISDVSDDEATAIEKLKQKIKERTQHLKSTIYDPDTSDEEGGGIEVNKSQKRPSKKGAKSTKSTPKPARMSAKQAMENMQKIKSESNRMLREKDVSLPYHRPKALSLKDIMSRRRPAVSADGKALPIKMNEDQLKQYAQILEERQKEMMELCKSESEEEENIDENEKDEELSSANDKSYDVLIENSNTEESKDNPQESIGNESEINKGDELSALNDQSFDTMVEQPDINEPISSIHDSMVNQSEINKSTEENVSTENVIKIDNQGDNNAIENTVNLETNSEETHEKLANVECKNDQDNDGLDGNASAEMELVYNDSVDDEDTTVKSSNLITENIATEEKDSNVCTENDSQLISLQLDLENTEPTVERTVNNGTENQRTTMRSEENEDLERSEVVENSEFQDNDDDDVNMEEIDFLIENAELISSQDRYFKEAAVNSPMLIKDLQPMKLKPKLTGAPGMVIDLDGTDACAPKKSGVELLKERFTYFAKLKTPEELEREKEKKIKPGMQHLKLKHQLEEMIAEQRSLEWTKRLEEEKQQKMEVEAVIGDADDDCEDDIDKIEAKLEENENVVEEQSSESEEEELVENDCDIKEKPRKKNPLLDEEAEESDDDTCAVNAQSDDDGNKGDDEGAEAENEDDDEEEDTEDESSDDEDEEQTKPKKGRILKAFEDSDDEDATNIKDNKESKDTSTEIEKANNLNDDCAPQIQSPPSKNTEDEEIQLAQRHKSFSEDLFTSQESVQLDNNGKENKRHSGEASVEDKTLASQTFSISKSSNTQWCNTEPSLTQSNEEGNLDDVVGMCTGSFSQNLVTSQTETQKESPSQDIGDDILALCTGKFYDNQFVSQLDTDNLTDKIERVQQNYDNPIDKDGTSIVEDNKLENNANTEESSVKNNTEEVVKNKLNENDKALRREDNNLLNSILDELNDPEFEKPKPLKYFVGNETQNKENKPDIANIQPKKRFIIDSDDEGNDNDVSAGKMKRKLKKKKLQDRALQFSDDEEELEECEEEYESEIEDDTERIVEYDSEENEVVQTENPRKKQKKASEFFEKEAELTSEDEWVGSGDEDEAGLDRMEREAGDDDHFHQGRLRRELEQIHMRDVLDQDKREVRLIQELLLEDGDLGGGHRQRKFRWKNTGGEDDETTHAELLDTQEEEFESEEQWRKQRHERETFLRQMKQQEEPEDTIDISVSRTSLIKANLSKTANNSVLDLSDSVADKSTSSTNEKKTAKDIPSPKKPFTLFQQNYHGSLLTRGQGALARLAALALPLAGADDDQPSARAAHSGRNFVFTALSQDEPPKLALPLAGADDDQPSARAAHSGRNFVFTALSQDEPPKVTKRKADANVGTPRLVKKMRTADNKKQTKNSLLDHMNT